MRNVGQCVFPRFGFVPLVPVRPGFSLVVSALIAISRLSCVNQKHYQPSLFSVHINQPIMPASTSTQPKSSKCTHVSKLPSTTKWATCGLSSIRPLFTTYPTYFAELRPGGENVFYSLDIAGDDATETCSLGCIDVRSSRSLWPSV